MELLDYIDDIKLQLTGGILESEISDEEYGRLIMLSMKEMNRYYNVTELLEVPGNSCIDLNEYPKVGTIVNVYRTSSLGSSESVSSVSDPVYVSQLQMYNFGNAYYSSDWVHNMAAWSLANQISNTTSTDLAFKEDKVGKKLYINLPKGNPSNLTVEYIPKLMDVSEIVSDYWIDILLRLSLAHCKIALGRIRTRYTQNNALWTGDGATLLAEGQEELKALRERLTASTDMVLPID